jgi:hypothetical protein
VFRFVRLDDFTLASRSDNEQQKPNLKMNTNREERTEKPERRSLRMREPRN